MLETQFLEWKKNYSSIAENYKKRSNRISSLRVIAFLLGVGLLYFSFQEASNSMGVVAVILTIATFAILVKIHNKTRFKKNIHEALAETNQNEIAYLSLKTQAFDSGDEYIDDYHPYSSDLDLFGQNSIFQLINRFSLRGMKQTLAEWFKSKGDRNEIISRQKAIQELSSEIEWTQYFIALTKIFDTGNKREAAFESLIDWTKERVELKREKLLGIARFMLPGVLLVVVLLSQLDILQLQPYLFIVLVVNTMILGGVFKLMLGLTKKINGALHIIKAYTHLIDHIENKDFDSQYLQELKAKLVSDGQIASKGIQELKSIVNQLDSRANIFFAVINICFLIDIHTLFRMIKWQSDYQKLLPIWLEAVHSFGALVSIASYSYSNTEASFPNLSEQGYHIETQGLGHPLIKAQSRVKNNFSIKDKGTIYLITGSNMSGKSTFLRTLGVNIVLAQMGAPVCANTFSWSLTNIFTSMRTHDDLSESISSFYAELKRIKQLLESIDEHTPTFFMLDEILKGTNSDDRHKGAEGLIKQLHQTNAQGLVSTHDLQLSSLEKETDFVKNFSFNSVISDENIRFDYTLSNGPCRSFNASFLMKKMGIHVASKG